ncbi:hypothetical protein N9Y92_03220 [Chlamydiales bacterium]|nr:hypothetical protein [Chlamydiales bacterium]
MKSISIGEALRVGWKGFLDNWLVFVVMLIIWPIVSICIWSFSPCAQVANSAAVTFSWSCLIFYIIGLFVNAFFYLGFVHAALQVVKNGKATFSNFWSEGTKILYFVIAQIIFSFIFSVGMFLLVFPAIIWGVKFSMYPYVIVDKKANGWNSLALSSKVTMGAKWDLLGFYMIEGLLLFTGVLVAGVGLLITLPVVMIAHAHIYNQLIHQGGE